MRPVVSTRWQGDGAAGGYVLKLRREGTPPGYSRTVSRPGLRIFTVAGVLAATACAEGEGSSEPEDSGDPSTPLSAGSGDPSNGYVDPSAGCDLHSYLAKWAGEGAMNCGELDDDAAPAEWMALHDCVLAMSDAGEPFFASWLGTFKPSGFAARAEPEVEMGKWFPSNIGWRASVCMDVIAEPNCTPGPGDPCLQCIDSSGLSLDSYCVYIP